MSISIKPLEDRIVVQTAEAEQTTASGLVIPDTAKEKPQEGKVVAVGPGRVEAILVSGDNRRAGYDEPTVMRRYLLSQGIPDQAVAVDYAGFDTYDTCVRARRVFGIERALLVTQDFHEPRAVAICRSVGVDVDGVGDSRARSDRIGWMVSWMRERPAAIKAVIDVVARRDPTLGRRETSVAEAIVWTREHRR